MSYERGLGVKPPKSLYLDLYWLDTKAEPLALQQFKLVLTTYKELTVKNVNEHISYLRMFKSKHEITNLEKAIEESLK